MIFIMRRIFFIVIIWVFVSASTSPVDPSYPYSKVIKSIRWHVDTYQSGAIGSDLFPTTWASDNKIYTAWGDGKGFSGDERRSYGVSVISGVPPILKIQDVFYGPKGDGKGKIIDIISVDGILYGTFSTQDDKWPNSSYRIIWSNDKGRSWKFTSWAWPRGAGTFEPRKFLQAGMDYSQAKNEYIYIYGREVGNPNEFFLARVQKKNMLDNQSYEYYSGLDQENMQLWRSHQKDKVAIFTDPNVKQYKINSFCVFYNMGIDRFLAVTSHGDAGQIGIFESPTPFGPWSTIDYYENWMGMSGGIFLSMSFPAKWINTEEQTMWAVFSVHGYPQPKTYHDKFNLIKMSMILFPKDRI